MALTKDWRDLPAELAPTAGETLAEHNARIDAYDLANPGVLTFLSAAALEDLETRAQAELDTKAATTHKASHAVGGADAITPADIGGVLAPGAHASVARVFGTVYQPSATRPVLVVASVYASCVAATARINFLCASVSPPAVKIAEIVLRNNAAAETIVQSPVTFLVPAGFYYRLTTEALGGAPTFGVTSVFEQAL